WPNVLHIHQREPASQQRPNLRHANCNANGDSYSDTYADFNTNVNSDSYGDIHAYSNGYSYSYADGGNADANAYLRAGSVMGDCCTSAYCALRHQRSFRWYVLLFNRRL